MRRKGFTNRKFFERLGRRHVHFHSMKMNLSWSRVTTFALLLTATFLTVRYIAQAKETGGPGVRVDNSPIARDARSGNSYAPIVKKVAPSVVNIYTARFIKERPMWSPLLNDPTFRQFFGDRFQGSERERTRKEQSLGSGVIVSSEGYILTANHVVAEADEIKVAIAGNKREYTARVIGKDSATDIAVLKIDEKNLPAVTLTDSDQLEVGDIVLALGNPFGVGQTVTMGIVSALERSGLGFNGYENFIQTDAAINPGNSGGALVDAQGRLVGINTAIISRSGGNQGIGLAVPINMARNVMERLISGGKVKRGFLAIAPQDIDAGLARQFNLPDQNGALIADVNPGGPADKAGLRSGDVIVGVNGRAITGADNLKVTISQLDPGTVAAVKIIRNGASKTINVTLGERPEIPGESQEASPENSGATMADALDGVSVQDISPDFRRQLRIPTTINGALVSGVDNNSNSFEAGLRPNDIILEINRQPVAEAVDAVRFGRAARGEEILLKIWRRTSANTAGTLFLSVENTKRAN